MVNSGVRAMADYSCLGGARIMNNAYCPNALFYNYRTVYLLCGSGVQVGRILLSHHHAAFGGPPLDIHERARDDTTTG